MKLPLYLRGLWLDLVVDMVVKERVGEPGPSRLERQVTLGIPKTLALVNGMLARCAAGPNETLVQSSMA
jgi:hypothetical protein